MRGVWVVGVVLALGGCMPRGCADAADAPLVVISGRSEGLVEALFKDAERELGFPIQVQYRSTPEMVTVALSEGDQSPADVFFAQESGHLQALADAGMLASLSTATLDAVDAAFRDPNGAWVGTSGRLRVLVLDDAAVAADARPASLRDLADPAFLDGFGWAPTNGSFQAHVSLLRHAWGEESTREWLGTIKDAAPRSFPKNSPIVEAVQGGKLKMGWVNHYYLHQMRNEGSSARNVSFSADADPGNLMLVAGVAVREGSPRAERGQQLAAWLVGEAAQAHFASAFEYPTRPGVPVHAGVQPLEEVSLYPASQAALADLEPTRELLRDLGLL